MSLEAAFRAAWERRADLHEADDTDAYRVFDGLYEGAPGWTVDRFGEVAHVRRYGDASGDLAPIAAGFGLRSPAPGPSACREAGLTFEVDLLRGRNPGLFLDARPMRAWVRALSDGRRVLNLFAYTCSLGVAAAAGGARSTTNVDLVRSALDRGRSNYAHNGLATDTRTFLEADVFDFCRRAAKRGETWDVVIADPPPVRTQGRRKGWDPARHLPRLIEAATELVADGGALLLMSAVRGRSRFEDVVGGEVAEVLARGADFPGPPEAGLRAVVLRPR